jgi:alkylhydroperoxidase/carboxymuconolactone decarboxylase family protein YurZ
MTELPSAPLARTDPGFEQMALKTGAATYGLQNLSVREKLLLCIGNDVCRGHFQLAMTMHVTACRMHDIPLADVVSAIRFIAPYSGYPAVADTLNRLGEIAEEMGLDILAAAEEASDPEATAASSRPGDVVPGLGASDPWFQEFVEEQTGRLWSETRLTQKECAYLALTADIAFQTLGESFRQHVQWALDAGASPDEVRDAIRFHAENGIGKTAEALMALDRVLETVGS